MIDVNVRALTGPVARLCRQPRTPARRHPQRRVGRGLPAGTEHGGLLRDQGLRRCRSAKRCIGSCAARHPRHRAVSGAGADRVPGARRLHRRPQPGPAHAVGRSGGRGRLSRPARRPAQWSCRVSRIVSRRRSCGSCRAACCSTRSAATIASATRCDSAGSVRRSRSCCLNAGLGAARRRPHRLAAKTARPRTDAIAVLDGVQQRLVCRQQGRIGERMPEVQHAGREPAVLALDAGAQQTDQQIGILEPPADIAGVEAIDPIEVGAPDRQVAGSRAPPILRTNLSHRSEPRLHQRRNPIDVAIEARATGVGKAPQFRLEVLG